MGICSFEKQRARLLGCFAVAAWWASLTGCYAQYNTNLVAADVSWGTVLSEERLPYAEGKGVVSQGPFFIDVNHREGALLVGPFVVWTNYSRPDDPKFAMGRIDLTHKLVEINAATDFAPFADPSDPLSRSRVYFWFQSELPRRAVAGGDETEMPQRFANYVLPINMLSTLVGGNDVALRIEPDLNQWECLGRNPVDVRPTIGSAAKYTCALDKAEFEQAMAHPIDMGLLILLPGQRVDGSAIDWLDPKKPSRTQILDGASFRLTKFVINCADCQPAVADTRAPPRHHWVSAGPAAPP